MAGAKQEKRGCLQKAVVGLGILAVAVGVCGGTAYLFQDQIVDAVRKPVPTGLVQPTSMPTGTGTPIPEAAPTVGALSSVDALIAQACRTQYEKITRGNYNQYLISIPRLEEYKDLTAQDKESTAMVNWYRNVLDAAKAKNIVNDPIVNYLRYLGVEEKNKFDLVTSEDLLTKEWAKNAKWAMFASDAGSLDVKVNKLADDMVAFYGKQGKTIDKAVYRQNLLKSAQINFAADKNPNAFMSMPVWYVNGDTEGYSLMEFSYNVTYGEDVFPKGPLSSADRVVLFVPVEKNPTGEVQAKAVVLDDFSRQVKVDIDKDGKFENDEVFWCDGSGNKGGGWTPVPPIKTITPTPTRTPEGTLPPPPGETVTPRATSTLQPPGSVPTATSQPAPVTPEVGVETSTPVHVSTPVPTAEETASPATAQPPDLPDNYATPESRPTAPVN